MKKVGLLLSGGMAKGAFQIGALETISEYIAPDEFSYVSAASVGVLNAYSFLTGNLDYAEKMWSNVNRDGTRTFITSMLRSTFLQDSINDIISDNRITPSFYTSLLNFKTRTLAYVDLSRVSPKYVGEYLRASVAMPVYNRAVTINGTAYYDGAMIDNIPVYPLIKHSPDYIICVYFDDYNYIFENVEFDRRIIKLTFPDTRVLSNAVSFSHDSIESLIEQGKQRTRRVLEYVFRDGVDDTEKILYRIDRLNQTNSKKNLRITGDMCLNNMNKVVGRLAKRRLIT